MVQLKIEQTIEIIDQALGLTQKSEVTKIIEDIKNQREIIIRQISIYRRVSINNPEVCNEFQETKVNEY